MAGNFIIHEQAKQYQWTGESFLSVKSFYNGQADYLVKGRNYQVGGQSFLLLNECSRYDITIDANVPTESFCVFFSPDFANQLIGECQATDEQLLDFSIRERQGSSFLERKYPQQGLIGELLISGRVQRIATGTSLQKQEYYHAVLGALMSLNHLADAEAAGLATKRISVRNEIYQRVCCARDFIEAYYREDLQLSTIAKVGMMSENHLLRCFSQVYGISPFRFISRLRIAEAQRLLKTTELSVSEIAMAVGYNSMSNFSTYFKQITGVSPSMCKQGEI